MSFRLKGAAEIISQRDYPNYEPDLEFTQEVADALDIADVARDIYRIKLDDHATEAVRLLLARGAYRVRAGELPYESQARSVVAMLRVLTND